MAPSARRATTQDRAGAGIPAPAPFRRILCGVDGSHGAATAARQALELAGTDAELTFAAVHGHVDSTTELQRAHAFEALRTAGLLERLPGVHLTDRLIEHAEPQHALVDAARDFDLLVVGSRGLSRGESILLGGTGSYAVHACDVPVLIARETSHGRPLGDHVVIASDGTLGIRDAAELAGAIAARAAGHATLAHVIVHDRDEIRRDLAQEATDLQSILGTEPVVRTVTGHPVDAIVDVAAEQDATLLVLGSRGLRGVRALASVSERVAARAGCSVLVLRPDRQPR